MKDLYLELGCYTVSIVFQVFRSGYEKLFMALVFVVSYDRDRGTFQEDDSRIFISCFYLSLIF